MPMIPIFLAFYHPTKIALFTPSSLEARDMGNIQHVLHMEEKKRVLRVGCFCGVSLGLVELSGRTMEEAEQIARARHRSHVDRFTK